MPEVFSPDAVEVPADAPDAVFSDGGNALPALSMDADQLTQVLQVFWFQEVTLLFLLAAVLLVSGLVFAVIVTKGWK